MAEYRAGRAASALVWLKRSAESGHRDPRCFAYTFYFWAMARHRLGDAAGAAEDLRRGAAYERTEAPFGQHWPDRIVLPIVRREAEAVLYGTPAETGADLPAAP
jgi:hypothetical protein